MHIDRILVLIVNNYFIPDKIHKINKDKFKNRLFDQ
jgi:hypothetical protein